MRCAEGRAVSAPRVVCKAHDVDDSVADCDCLELEEDLEGHFLEEFPGAWVSVDLECDSEDDCACEEGKCGECACCDYDVPGQSLVFALAQFHFPCSPELSDDANSDSDALVF